VSGVESGDRVMLRIIAANVGLDPAKDINWIVSRDPKELFVKGEVDAFLTFPPWVQEVRARNVGHLIVNSGLDRPWSQHFCCMLIGASDFVRRNPIATKRVVRAMVRATDICWPNPAGSRNAWSIGASRRATTMCGRGSTTSPIATGASTTSKTRSVSTLCVCASSARSSRRPTRPSQWGRIFGS
jgi:ABC-type nitrate/sulfonate/bicarbonate transport system substrate-binding protein